MEARTAEFGAARLEHLILPPHEESGYTSTSAPYAIGVAFTGQARALVRHDDEPVRTIGFRPGTIGINGGRPLTWLRTTEPSESVEIVPSAVALALAAEEHGTSWDRLESYRQRGQDPVVWAASATVRRLLAADLMTAGIAEELVTRLLAHVAVQYAGGTPLTLAGISAGQVTAVIDRIHDEPWAGHSLRDLAATAHLSPYHFLRIFRTVTGLTPHRYVSAVRAEQAHRLLEVRGATVSAVAAALATDARSLRRLHRRELGRSPRGR
jgi:AraC-like DNA-binding protein